MKIRRRNWARLIQKVWLDDPELCPRCGRRMRVIAAISSPAQDDVIEKEGPPRKNRIEHDEGHRPGKEDWDEGVYPDPTPE